MSRLTQILAGGRFGWLRLLVLLGMANILAIGYHGSIDLTAEKRFTLSKPTEDMLGQLQEQVDITVLLDGDMPPGFRKLASSTEDMLEGMRNLAPLHISYRFERPAAGLHDSLKGYVFDSLQQLGIHPTNVKAQTKKGESTEETLLFPGAVVRYKDRVMGVDFLQGQEMSGLASLNNAEALLEYRIADAIRRIKEDSIQMVGYLTGNDEPLDLRVYDLIENTLRDRYAFRILPIDSVPYIPPVFKAICIVKPMKRFSQEQKLKIDQYVMHGGHVIWMIDNLYASLDSLQRSEGQFIAFDTGLDIEDLLFRYGVRINRDLVQDLQNDGIPSVIGSVGDKPQIQVLPWPYFPLLRHGGHHPIAKNLDYVLSQFPQSIDTVDAPGIRKTVLLTSSDQSRILQSPARVAWASIQNEEELREFRQKQVPVAVLLEGRFRSLFANRLSKSVQDSMAAVYGQPFLPEATVDSKMIVIADGDLALNPVSQKDGPLSMGMNAYTRRQYANREFLLNSLEYMTDPSGILETRGKDFTLRLLDQEKVEEQKTAWLVANFAGPMALVSIFIAIFQAWRKRRFAKA